MKTAIIVQARMTSTRLPGKVLKAVLGKPLLEYQIERLLRVKFADEIIIATTTNDTDRPIIELCNRLNIPYFCGPEEDLLFRYYEAAKKYAADVLVRITSDCPIIDPLVVDKVIKYYFDNQEIYDYVSNTLKPSYPVGMDTEIFSLKVLSEAFFEAVSKPDREHVTTFIYMQPERYSLGNVSYEKNKSYYRLTVDTIEDFRLIEKILSALYPENPLFTLEHCLSLIEHNPELKKINSSVRHKEYGE